MSARQMKEHERQEFIEALCDMDPVFAANWRALVWNTGISGREKDQIAFWLIQSAQARQRRQGARRAA